MTELNECAYCGKVDPETRDHLPPKSFFPSPRPANLITVPCCEVCRSGQSKDDETIRLILAVHEKAGRHPAMQKLNPVRALQKLQKWRFAKYFLGLRRTTVVQTPSGVVAPKHDLMIEREPLTGFLTRLTRGMHFHHARQRLPTEWTVFPVIEPLFDNPMAADILARLRKEREISFGDSVFQYRFAILLGHTTVWLFRFYGSVEFVTLAVAPDARSKPPSGTWLRSSTV